MLRVQQGGHALGSLIDPANQTGAVIRPKSIAGQKFCSTPQTATTITARPAIRAPCSKALPVAQILCRAAHHARPPPALLRIYANGGSSALRRLSRHAMTAPWRTTPYLPAIFLPPGRRFT